jgi:hypothetical protein
MLEPRVIMMLASLNNVRYFLCMIAPITVLDYALSCR